jgi:hypothetical protein
MDHIAEVIMVFCAANIVSLASAGFPRIPANRRAVPALNKRLRKKDTGAVDFAAPYSTYK